LKAKVIFISTVFPDFSIKDLSSSCLFLFPPSFLILLVTKAVPVYHFPHACGNSVPLDWIGKEAHCQALCRIFLTLLKLFTAGQQSNKAVPMQHNSYLQIFLHCLLASLLFIFPFYIHHLTLLSFTPSGDIFQNINPLPALAPILASRPGHFSPAAPPGPEAEEGGVAPAADTRRGGGRGTARLSNRSALT
jgi:hypothetical protein